MKQKLIEMKVDVDILTIIIRNINTPTFSNGYEDQADDQQEIEDLKNTVN